MTLEERAAEVVQHISRVLVLDKCQELCERTRLLLLEQLRQVRNETVSEVGRPSEN